MKIITVSKFYFRRSDLENYLFNITDILREKGHEIVPFATSCKNNYFNDNDDFYTEYTDIEGEKEFALAKKITAVKRIFYNDDIGKKFALLLDYTKPDIVWGFGINRYISPSIFIEAQRRNIPVIHRFSDYDIICPYSKDNGNYSPLMHEEKNGKESGHKAILKKCFKLIKGNEGEKANGKESLTDAAELYFYNRFKFYTNNVDKFIAPSYFIKNIMLKSGVPEDKISFIPVYIDSSKYTPEVESMPYLVYFGRLTREKGLPVVLEAMSGIRNFRLIIVGDGDERENLERIKKQKKLDNVEFTGKLYGEELSEVVKNARLVVQPSIWFDSSPNAVLEAFSYGKPVIGANIGGIPEYINEGFDGLLYNCNNARELREKIKFLMNQPKLCQDMGISARQKVETLYNPALHYERLIGEFHRILDNKDDLNGKVHSIGA